ncbi:MAG TPA: HAD family phosphatase [Phototrophicaceae bacterium]|nr:HAD family phosphatase [Phototrophicaceae bacterium]
MNNRRALILDFDGVLVDSEPIHFASWNQAFTEILGLRVVGGHTQLVGLALEEIYQLWLRANTGAPIELTPELRTQLLARKTELFFAIGAERLTPMPGSLDLIHTAQAQGWYVAVVSRSLRLRLHRTLELMRMPALFDLVLGSEYAVDPQSGRKDHARAAAMFGIDPARCVAVEDSASGIADAVAAGIGGVIGLTTSLEVTVLQAAGAHEVVDSLAAIRLEET